MKIQQAVLVFLFSTICIPKSFGQGTIQMLNGKEKRYMTYKVQDEYVLFQPESKPDSWSKRLDRFNVFSITPDNGAEIVVYDPDTTDGLEPNVQEAREFIAGEKLAIAEYRKPLNVISGIGVGIGSGFAQYFGIPVPVVYSAAIGRVSPRLPKAHRDLQYSEPFVAGYQKKARTMKINKSLLGGGIGFALGFTAFALFLAD
ncbi:MAG: hypothetical protein ACK560_09495 [Bacteroidota bacterium]|jgi:hypothetical protein